MLARNVRVRRAARTAADCRSSARRAASRAIRSAFLSGAADRYGDIVNFRLGGLDVFFVRHPDYVREVLITQRASFTMTSLRAKINAVVGERAVHLARRTARAPAAIDAAGVPQVPHRGLCGQMAELSQRMRDQWQAGATIDIADEMMKLTMLIAAKALFEQDIGSDTQSVSRNIGITLEFFTRLSSPFLKPLARAAAAVDAAVQRRRCATWTR